MRLPKLGNLKAVELSKFDPLRNPAIQIQINQKQTSMIKESPYINHPTKISETKINIDFQKLRDSQQIPIWEN